MASPPVPPAPPPPPLPPGAPDLVALVGRRNQEPPIQDPVSAVCHRWSFLSKEYPVALVKYLNLDPIIQQGPQCGLVALVMIANALGRKTTVEDAFRLAREKGFTNFGEIFDVCNMKRLCCKVVGRVSTVIAFPEKSAMIEDVIKGKVFLVPYDADSNHEPCRRNGRSAHWAVIFGVLLMRPECYCLEGLEKLDEKKPIYRAEIGYDCELGGYDFLFARQGKSRHVAVWKYDDLRDSCLQLNEASDKYEGMVLPDGGIQQGLKGKVLRLDLISASEGKCVAEVTLEKSHLNLAGTMHGAFSATLIDNISTYALLTVTDSRSASVDLNVTFLGTAKEGDLVRIEASTLKAGQTLAFLTVDIRKGDKLLVTGRHTKYLQKDVDYYGNKK